MSAIIDEIEPTVDVESMMLADLLKGVAVSKMFQTLYGHMVVTQDVQVNRVQYDSRKITRGDVFVAIHGNEADGHAFIQQAIDHGAKVVLMENDNVLPDAFFMHAGVVKIVVPNSRVALSQLAANYFHHPSAQLLTVGVTGTNGKTTTTHLITSILEAYNKRTGLIGTIEYRIGDKIIPATHTTPESLELNELFAKMVERNCSSVVMEVSSHALHQHRVDGIQFKAAVFTNLTQDHLDYHKSMEEYFNAKRLLFEHLDPTSFAIVNADDAWADRMCQSTRARVVRYGVSANTTVHAKNVSLSAQGTSFSIIHNNEETKISSALIGRFNVSNILAAFSTGIALGIPKHVMQQAINQTSSVRGRFERIVAPKGWTAIIDYAHTPDALLKALMAVHDIFHNSRRGKIITVFGCGGNRDRTKRPQMARIATEHSDLTIITSDNPRHEDPEAIIDEVMTGVRAGAHVLREQDRRKAVERALEHASPHDVILIAGKGHEDYQVVGGQKVYFNDREVVEEYLRLHA